MTDTALFTNGYLTPEIKALDHDPHQILATINRQFDAFKSENDFRLSQIEKKRASDVLTDADKQKLLSYLQASHGTSTGERKKITLVKKSTSEIKQADATGRFRHPLDPERVPGGSSGGATAAVAARLADAANAASASSGVATSA